MNNPLATEPTRIALAGDWHGDLPWARRVIEFAVEQDCDGIVQLGDFGIHCDYEGRMFLNGLQASLVENDIWCAFIDGNHENFWHLNSLPLDESGLRPVRENLWHIPRGTRWQWGGRTWLGLGGATSLDKHRLKLGRSWWPEEAITAADFETAVTGGPVDVMLTHDCPAGVNIPGLSQDWHPEALALAEAHRRILAAVAELVTPAELWHGHMHIRYREEVEFAGVKCVVNGLGHNKPYKRPNRILGNVVILDINVNA